MNDRILLPLRMAIISIFALKSFCSLGDLGTFSIVKMAKNGITSKITKIVRGIIEILVRTNEMQELSKARGFFLQRNNNS